MCSNSEGAKGAGKLSHRHSQPFGGNEPNLLREEMAPKGVEKSWTWPAGDRQLLGLLRFRMQRFSAQGPGDGLRPVRPKTILPGLGFSQSPTPPHPTPRAKRGLPWAPSRLSCFLCKIVFSDGSFINKV